MADTGTSNDAALVFAAGPPPGSLDVVGMTVNFMQNATKPELQNQLKLSHRSMSGDKTDLVKRLMAGHLHALGNQELQTILEANNLTKSGNKDELIERILTNVVARVCEENSKRRKRRRSSVTPAAAPLPTVASTIATPPAATPKKRKAKDRTKSPSKEKDNKKKKKKKSKVEAPVAKESGLSCSDILAQAKGEKEAILQEMAAIDAKVAELMNSKKEKEALLNVAEAKIAHAHALLNMCEKQKEL